MTGRRPPLLAAVVDAVWTADPDQLPLTRHGLVGRVWNRLGAVVSHQEVVAAATHLLPVGLVASEDGTWRPGLVRPDWAPIEQRHEDVFWSSQGAVRGWPQ